MRAAAILAAVVAAFGASTSAQALPRVASAGLCADQYLLMLADREQIASVSWQATSALSVYADRARGLPTNRASAEELISSGATVVLSSDGLNKPTSDALKRLGVEVIDLPFANTFAEVEALTRRIAARLGRPQAGERVIHDMRARLANIRAVEPASSWPVLAYYRPDGGSGGIGTFVDSTLQAAGYRNLQVMRGVSGWGALPAEAVVTTPPDIFGVSYFDTGANSTAVLRRNPVLWGAARNRRVVSIPGKYWNCGSPLLVEAAELLARERPAVLSERKARRAR